ncbi:hypothetical protein TWF696_009215 [Orbilia brochopaga]|uniref:Uncharacterized protein n=1 Tax=Orbilia brochopaga TaxID=3140254 RepID=A0AAV9UGT6_9PEZI
MPEAALVDAPGVKNPGGRTMGENPVASAYLTRRRSFVGKNPRSWEGSRKPEMASSFAPGASGSGPGPRGRRGSPRRRHGLIELLEIEKEFPVLPPNRKTHPPDYRDLTDLRQEGCCILTGEDFQDDCQETICLFPFTMMNLASDRNKVVWRFLAIFLGEELRDKLVAELTSELHGVYTAANALSFQGGLGSRMEITVLTMIPTAQSQPPGYFVDVKLVWHVSRGRGGFATSLPREPENQYEYDDEGHPTVRVQMPDVEGRQTGSFRIATADPVDLPIPSPLLLFWYAFIGDVMGHAGDLNHRLYLQEEDE